MTSKEDKVGKRNK